jgi:AmmeMemoRadiSam system protein A
MAWPTAVRSSRTWRPCQPNSASRVPRSSTFVTLHLDGQLRGCIGSLEAHRPLAEDVAANAFAAAFRDPRFPPVSRAEAARLALEISVLSPAEPMHFRSEADLLAQLRPGIDGLILSDLGRRGTFLPSVWSQLPAARDFLVHLKHKAGLPADHWSATLSVERYTTESFG